MKIESSFNVYLCCPFILLDYKSFSFLDCLFFLFIKFYIRLSIMQNIKTLVCAEMMNNRCWKSLVKSTHIHRNILLKRICIQVKNLITNLFVLQTSPGTFSLSSERQLSAAWIKKLCDPVSGITAR